MAALIRNLAVSGSRKTDGTANASGKVLLYSPGTTIIVPGYKDDQLSEAWTTSNGGIPLDAGGKVKIWLNDMVDVVVQDSDGTTVDTMLGFNKTRAEQVEIENENFLGALTDSSGAVTQDLGGRTDLDAVLTRAADSLGPDFKYQESAGATARPYIEVIRDKGISVKDFGAIGNGVADDTSAMQRAASRAVAASRDLLIPSGSYKTSQALTLTSASGVKVIGQGRGSTIIKPTHGTANAFTFTACASSGIYGMSILHATGSTGAAVAVGGASPNFKAVDLYVPAVFGTYTGFAYGLDFSGASDFDLIAYCDMLGSTRTIRENATSSAKPQVIIGCNLGASSAAPISSASAIEFNGANGSYYIFGSRIVGATNNILLNASFTGGDIIVVGGSLSSVLGSAPINYSGITALKHLYRDCGVDGYTVNVASAGTATPDLSQGRHIRIRATSTGSAITVAAPTPVPTASTRDFYIRLTFYNNAGGAITGWTMNAAYHLSSGPSTTDGQLTSYLLLWDADASVWREHSRSVTT